MENQLVTTQAPRRSRALLRGLGAVTIAFFWGCASDAPVDEEIPSAETLYQRGLELLEGSRTLLLFRDTDYTRAIEAFQEVIDNYPYSEQAPLAELQIAEIHYERGSYEEAASYYQDFVELHPSHEKAPWAIYRAGLCAFERMGDVDQDQDRTQDAIAQFKAVLERYPDSEYTGLAREKLAEAQDRLAHHDIQVGDFYRRRGECHSAALRYRHALDTYPEHRARFDTMLRLADCLRALRDYDGAQSLYQEILASGADEQLARRAQEELAELGAQPGNGAAVPKEVTEPGAP